MPTSSVRPGHHPRRRRPRGALLVALPLALLALVVAVALPSTGAAFTATTTGASGTASAAAVFPDYPTQVGTAPRFWHRGDDAVSSAAAPAAADSSGHSLLRRLRRVHRRAQRVVEAGRDLWHHAADVVGGGQPRHAHNGGAATAPAWTTGRRVGAISLDGVDDAVVGARPAVDTGTDFTVSAWVHLCGPPARHQRLRRQPERHQPGRRWPWSSASPERRTCNCWALRTTNSDAPALRSSDRPARSTTDTAVRDVDAPARGARVRPRCASTSTASTSPAGTTAAPGRRPSRAPGRRTAPCRWAGRWSTRHVPPGSHFPGKVDEVKTWRRALSAAEVEEQYTGGRAGVLALQRRNWHQRHHHLRPHRQHTAANPPTPPPPPR